VLYLFHNIVSTVNGCILINILKWLSVSW